MKQVFRTETAFGMGCKQVVRVFVWDDARGTDVPPEHTFSLKLIADIQRIAYRFYMVGCICAACQVYGKQQCGDCLISNHRVYVLESSFFRYQSFCT